MSSQSMAAAAPLILTVGIPGSGKSTWAENLAVQKAVEKKHYQIISTDLIRAQLYGDAAVQGEWIEIRRSLINQLKFARQSIDGGRTAAVIYDATNAVRRQRREFIRMARSCRYCPLIAAWMDTIFCFLPNLRATVPDAISRSPIIACDGIICSWHIKTLRERVSD